MNVHNFMIFCTYNKLYQATNKMNFITLCQLALYYKAEYRPTFDAL